MNQSARDVTLLDRSAEVFLFAAHHAGNKIRKVVFLGLSRGWTGFLIFSHPGLVAAVTDREISLRPIENVADRVVGASQGAELGTRGA